MPIIKSAIKRLRQNEKRRQRNLVRKNAMKNAIKEYKKMLEAGDVKGATESLPKVQKAIDKAAKHKVIEKNTASRRKSWCANALAKAGK